MVYYSSYNRYYSIQGIVASSLIITLIWFAQNVTTPGKVVLTTVLTVALIILLFGSSLPRIVIYDIGIKVQGSYAGPFKSVSEYTPYNWQWNKTALTFEWSHIRSLRVGVWKPWFRDITNIFTSTHFYYRDSYLIIEDERAECFVVAIVGSPFSWGRRYENPVIAAIQKAGKDYLLVPEVVKL